MYSIRITSCSLALALALTALPLTGAAQDLTPTQPIYKSELMPLATTRSLILDVTEAASRAVAVGERGHVLVSESRTDWRQVPDVPTRATLTAVTAVADNVWAVGHDGTIIASRDGGLTWTLQRRDVLDTSPDAVFDPRQGVPLLDILMLDAAHGFAVGAYSQLLRTDDGGVSWSFVETGSVDEQPDANLDQAETNSVGDDDSWTFSAEDLAMDDLAEPHFNAITHTGSGALFIVGERGNAFRSRDDGLTWERLRLPYGGSMFGVIGYQDDHVVVYGMRGNAFESRDLGDSWTQIDTGTDLSLMGGAAYGENGFVMVGANGVVLMRPDGQSAPREQVFTNANHETPVLAAVMVRPNRSLILAGDKGVDSFTSGNK